MKTSFRVLINIVSIIMISLIMTTGCLMPQSSVFHEFSNGDTIMKFTSMGDYWFVYHRSSESLELFPVRARDCMDRLVVFKLSADETKLVGLVNNSSYYEHNTRLWGFDLTLPAKDGKLPPLWDITDQKVLDAEIDNDRIRYEVTGPNGQKEWKDLEFPSR